jgi:hypothetical protein
MNDEVLMKIKRLPFAARTMALLLISMMPVAFARAADNERPKPPAQPESGPGGKDYKHASFTVKSFGQGATQYWIYQPAEPTPKSAPVTVFNHGWIATDPWVYSAWIEHIVRRGNIVIYPRYQENAMTPPQQFARNAIIAVKDALIRMEVEDGYVRPDLDKFAIVGHSAGGLLSANMAALAQESKLPVPRAVMPVQPGRTDVNNPNFGFVLEDLGKIPAQTLMLCIAGDKDNVCADTDARKIYKGATSIPPENKNLIIILSDDHGYPPLNATHMAPVAFDEKKEFDDVKPKGQGGNAAPPNAAPNNNNAGGFPFMALMSGDMSAVKEFLRTDAGREFRKGMVNMPLYSDLVDSINAQDYYGYWRLFDALCDAAFYGKNRDMALGNTEKQRFMGKWSDGKPVKELLVIEKP